ncbi:GTP-binding protein [Streptomyces angustmyceticus]|uniref:GTP-binding protein n=1 Tax=Streptomyces angustmyceticus TaxID=285578 RepID=UPI003D93732B
MLPSHTLNIGILAHVDAGKTSLTERLLFHTGAIGRLGSVDTGDTTTDTGELERRRGITIRSAVASFAVGDTQVNLLDTPGHSDFIAEVERALGVLDGAVLLLSAVEGVQARTRVLMRTLRRLRLPTLLFINKIDRVGARDEALLADIRRLLAPAAVPMTSVTGLGTPRAEVVPYTLEDPRVRERVAETLAEVDESVLAELVGADPGPGGQVPTVERVRAALAARTADGSVHPVYFGSALGGQGVGALVAGMAGLIPPAPRCWRSPTRTRCCGPAPRRTARPRCCCTARCRRRSSRPPCVRSTASRPRSRPAGWCASSGRAASARPARRSPGAATPAPGPRSASASSRAPAAPARSSPTRRNSAPCRTASTRPSRRPHWPACGTGRTAGR